jgi:hypothetical protein
VSSPHSRFLPAALVEDKVVQQWRVERMSEPQARLIRDNLLVDLVEYAKASSTAAIGLDRRIDAIRRERRKWAEKAIKGSIPDDIAREKKQELSGPLIAAESAGAKLTITSDQHETAIRSTTALLPPVARPTGVATNNFDVSTTRHGSTRSDSPPRRDSRPASGNLAAARGSDTRLNAVDYAFTRSPDAADFSMAAMTSWRRTASVKSGTV